MVVWKACCCGYWCCRWGELLAVAVAGAGAVGVDGEIAGIASWNRLKELLAVAVAGAGAGAVVVVVYIAGIAWWNRLGESLAVAGAGAVVVDVDIAGIA